MGGGVALDLTLTHPERVARLVLIATGPRVPRTAEASAPITLLRTHGKTRAVMAEILHHWFYRQPDADEFEPILEDAMRWPEEALFEVRASLEANDYSSRLREIAVPTLVIHGERDHTRPVEQARDTAKALPDGRLVVIPEAGHTPMHEAPAEFNRKFWPFVAAAAQEESP
jgi:pimeloyl-ACP methyl ester carboxylesterase